MLELSKQIIRLHGHHGYESVRYFTWMIDDCLADFGKRPSKDQIPPKEVIPTISILGATYADEVIKHEPFFDVLGQIYMELSSQYGKKTLGQYFTPWPVAKMMSAITLDTGLYDKQQIVRIADIAGCGSGIMMLAAASNIMQKNPDYLKCSSFTGIDVDSVCSKMFPLQLLANTLVHQLEIGEILSYQGDGLGPFEKLNVVVHATGPNLPKEEFIPAKAPVREQMIKSESKVFKKDDQLGLF